MRSVVERIARTPRDGLWLLGAACGLALCLMLTATFDTVLASNLLVAGFDYRLFGTPLSGNFPVFVACSVMAAWAWRQSAIPLFGNAFASIASIVMVISLEFLVISAPGTISVAASVSWFCAAAASTILLVRWVQALARIGRERSLFVFSLALLLDMLADVCLAGVPRVTLAFAIPCAAIGSTLALLLFERAMHDDGPRALFGGSAQHNVAPQIESLPLPLSLLVLVCFGMAVGFIQAVGVASESFGMVLAASIPRIATVAASLAMLGLALVFSRIKNPDAWLRASAFTVLLVAVYVTGVFGTHSAEAGLLSSTITRIAAFAYVWLLACEALPHPTRASFVFACGWGLFMLALTVSTRLGDMLLVTDGPGRAAYHAIIAISLALLVFVNIYPQLTRRGQRDLSRTASIAASEADAAAVADASAVLAEPSATGSPAKTGEAPDRYERGCAVLAKRYELTAREAQVLLPLVRGRSNSSIAASLVVGTETIRTHIRHIYQKTGIHSREELMDAVEELGAFDEKA